MHRMTFLRSFGHTLNVYTMDEIGRGTERGRNRVAAIILTAAPAPPELRVCNITRFSFQVTRLLDTLG